MTDRTIAKRYARALMAVAVEHDALDECRADLLALRGVLSADPRAIQLLASPVLPAHDRRGLFDRLTAVVDVREHVLCLARLLLERGRIDLIGHIAGIFDDLIDQHRGHVKANIISAAPLTDDGREYIRSLLEQRVGKTILLSNQVDPSILGGAVLRIGNRVVDGSVKTRLSQMRQALSARPHPSAASGPPDR